MDIQTSHLLSKLDRIIDTQQDQRECLHLILATVESRDQLAPSEVQAKLPTPAGIVIRGALMWTLGATIIGYLAHGGDPIALIEVLLKFFG